MGDLKSSREWIKNETTKRLKWSGNRRNDDNANSGKPGNYAGTIRLYNKRAIEQWGVMSHGV